MTSCIRVMPAVAVTVLDGSDVIWSGRLVRVDESDKLKDILRKLVPEEDVQRLEKVQSAVSDSSARYEMMKSAYIYSLGDDMSTSVWACVEDSENHTF